MALLGNSTQDGIVGSGKTVEEALSEFDSRYLDALHPPAERGSSVRTLLS